MPAGKGRRITASIKSINDVDADAKTPKWVLLVFRDHPSWGRSSYLVLQNGDFNCYGHCTVKVTVDAAAAKPMAAHRPKTDEAIAMFIDDARAFYRLTAEAKQVSVEFPGEGRRHAHGVIRSRRPGPIEAARLGQSPVEVGRAVTLLPLFPLPERGALSRRPSPAPHLRASVPRDDRRRARGRSPARDGAAAAWVGNRLRGAAADFPGRLQRRHRVSTELEDGRYNIVLRGLDRFRVVSEDHERAYRRARDRGSADRPLDGQRPRLAALTFARPSPAAGLGLCRSRFRRCRTLSWSTRRAALDFEPIEKQALLERENLSLRARALRRV